MFKATMTKADAEAFVATAKKTDATLELVKAMLVARGFGPGTVARVVKAWNADDQDGRFFVG